MNAGEKKLCDYIYNRSGSFFKSLFAVIFSADSSNLKKLYLSFPEETDSVLRYKNGNKYWEKLEKEYNNG